MAQIPKMEPIVDFHIHRDEGRKQKAQYSEERLQGDLYNLKHNHRCVCYAPRRPLYSSLWPLKGFREPLELNNDPPKHDHKLQALTGRFNYFESEWKTLDILQYDFEKKIWFELATLPENYVKGHFQLSSWDSMHAYNYQDKIWLKRTDGVSQGAVYDCEKKTWDLDWRFPIFPEGTAWFHSIAPYNIILNGTPWVKYLPKCITHGMDED
jgi:hypothetical protein